MLFEEKDSPKVVFRDYQEEMAENTIKNLFELGHRGTANIAPMGCGKCHARGTRVMLADGTSRAVEDVRIGDKLMGPDGNPRTVLELSSGNGPMYRVRPTKGDDYYVNENHVLSLKVTKGYNLGTKSAVHVSGQIVNISVSDYLSKSKWLRSCLKGYRVGLEFADEEVQLDPYLLGVWLGDGTSTRPEITTADEEIVSVIRDAAEKMGLRVVKKTKPGNRASTYSLSGLSGNYARKDHKNEFLEKLRQMNLINNKHIPLNYKLNSRSARMQLLAGIIDTDGHCASNKYYEFVSKSHVLAKDVAWIARSLGFAAYLKECVKKCCNNGVVGNYYRVSICGDVSKIPVRIARKKADPRRQKKDVLVTAIEVSRVDDADYFGFEIDGDHLYLLEDFTVNHNSLTMAKTASDGSVHGGVLILAHFKTLVRQNRNAVERLGRECFLFHGEEKTVPSWQYVKKNGAIVSAGVAAMLHALPKIDPDTFKLILIDEGHHAVVDSAYHTIAKHFGAKVAIYTATPDREDGRALIGDKALCESIAYNGQVRDFVRLGWILLPRITFEKSLNLDYSVIPTDGSRITEKQAEAVWMNHKAHFAVIKPFLEKCGGMQSIGFAPTVRLAKLWSEMCNEDRPGLSEYVASYKPGDYTDGRFDFDSSERRLIESRYDEGLTQYLWNKGCYLEGADLVAARVCMLGSATSSRSVLAQEIGRVLRPCNDDNGVSILVGHERDTPEQRKELIAKSKKPDAIVLDYTTDGTTARLKLVHPVDLYQIDGRMDEKLRERIINRMDELQERGEDRISLEEVMLEQEEAYKKFLVRDARVRKALAIEMEVSTTDIDPFGPPEVVGHQRYVVRKINPPPAGVVERIRKLTKELGKSYSKDFYATLSHSKAFGVAKGLQAKVDALRKTKACPEWVTRELQAKGDYNQYQSEYAGRQALYRRGKK